MFVLQITERQTKAHWASPSPLLAPKVSSPLLLPKYANVSTYHHFRKDNKSVVGSWLALPLYKLVFTIRWTFKADTEKRQLYLFMWATTFIFPHPCHGWVPPLVNTWFDSKGCPGQGTLAHKQNYYWLPVTPNSTGIHVLVDHHPWTKNFSDHNNSSVYPFHSGQLD